MSTQDVLDGEATMPEIPFVIEGLTDRTAVATGPGLETQIAARPAHQTTPVTRIVHTVAPAPSDAQAEGQTPNGETVHTSALDSPGEWPDSPDTEAFNPISPAGSDPDEEPDLPRTDSTGESSFIPELRLRRRLLYTSSVLVLIIVIVFCFHQLKSLGGSGKTDTVDGTRSPVQEAQPVVPEPPAASPTALAELEMLDRGRKTPRLLALSLDEILPEGRSRVVQIGREPIEAGVVTIVNLWATYCEPCKRELPEFAEVLRRSAWGRDVRFTPILIDDKDPVWAHSQFASLMPEDSRFFVDPLQGAVLAVLREAGLLRGHSGLPITLVYDCNQRARLVYTQALTAANLEQLEGIVGDLHKELKSSRCVKPRVTPTADSLLKSPGKAAPASCPNGRCEPDEPAKTCAGLKCPGGQRCEEPNGEPRCVVVAGGLKE